MDNRIIRVFRYMGEEVRAEEVARFVSWAEARAYVRNHPEGRDRILHVRKVKGGKFIVEDERFQEMKPRSLTGILDLLESSGEHGLWSDLVNSRKLVEPLPAG
jgi:hypothetical protein